MSKLKNLSVDLKKGGAKPHKSSISYLMILGAKRLVEETETVSLSDLNKKIELSHRELSAIGNNLNQIARNSNAGEEIDHRGITEAIKIFKELRKEIGEITTNV